MSNISGERNSELSIEERRRWLSVLATSAAGDLLPLWERLGLTPSFRFLRRPEIGAVMTQGRIGATGEAFNLGETTATRCSVRLESGEEGHAYALGRDLKKIEVAALCDALMQTELRDRIERDVLTPLSDARAATRETAARKAAATKVEFFTMTRGDDA